MCVDLPLDRACGERQVQVDEEQLLVELCSSCEHLAVRCNNDRVAVEDELVLAAGHVDVGERRARLRRAATGQLATDVVFVPFVRRPVDVGDEPDSGGAADRDRPAVLPQVLADRHCDVDAVQPDDAE